ncbi:hypothetical protein Pla144_03070 [Bythopirellula polymerisocia]|uniref:Uncharacterized protein n=1 Tax=Bythopirellula polymerisocia TaxID=2528003 RepID=A0A5C6D3W2_9BACT|nr:hypothetical protein Pla144_03070 [Bythopirellula polymerisocia]
MNVVSINANEIIVKKTVKELIDSVTNSQLSRNDLLHYAQLNQFLIDRVNTSSAKN